ncbi:MAG: hypothetical protein RBR37_05750 [Advenella sp.]|nr:hypothetical protein [Advenella sp.]
MSISKLSKQISPDWVSLSQSRLWQEQPTQIELENLLLDIWPVLQGLHQQNRIYGICSPETVFLDRAGRAHLLPVTAEQWQDQGEGNHYAAGYAAFEQHANDPAWAIGAWTDVYGVAILLRTLILKQAPVCALKRMIRDELSPLSGQVNGFTRRFLRAIDCATVLEPNVRLRSIDELVVAMGLADIAEIQGREPIAVQKTVATRQAVPPPPPQSPPLSKMSGAQVHGQTRPDLAVRKETEQQPEPQSPAQTVLPAKTAQGSHENDEEQPAGKQENALPTDSLQLQQQYLASQKNAQRKPVWALMALVLAGAAVAVYFYTGNVSQTEAANTSAGIVQTLQNDTPPVSLAAGQEEIPDSKERQEEQPERFVAEAVTGIPGLGVAGTVDPAQESLLNEPSPVMSEEPEMAGINQQALIQAEQIRQEQLRQEQIQQAQMQLQEQEAALALQAAEEEARRRHDMEQEQLRLAAIEQEKQEQKRLAREKREEEQRRKEQEQARMATVSFAIQPWGEVSVNGRKRGASPPLRVLKLSPGTHVIDIRNGDLPVHTVTVDLQSRQEITVSYKF